MPAILANASANMLRWILALPLPVGQARQPDETSLNDGGELGEGCLRNRFETGKSWPFGSGNALPGVSGSLALERMQKKIAAVGTDGILSSLGKQHGNRGLSSRIFVAGRRGLVGRGHGGWNPGQ